MTSKWSLATLIPLVLAGPVFAQPPSYSRHVQPFLAKYCLECHSADKAKGGLSLESFQSLTKGGDNGPVLVPGNPDASPLVLLVEGKEKRVMPPKTAKQPPAAERGVLRAWVAAGAKEDAVTAATTLPDIKPRVPAAAPVAALAYAPDGKTLAAAGNLEVVLLDVATGDVGNKLPGQTGRVTALAYRPDGSALAVASGAAGASGEISIHDSSGKSPTFKLTPHKDLIYALAWSPDGKILASAGYDRVIQLWDAAAGKQLRSLKDHSDAIYGLAFSADGKLLASAAADRAVKVWDIATGKRLYTLGEATDWLYAVAWSPDGKHLAAAGVDKSIRVWEVNAAGGKLVHSVFAHEAPVTRLAYTRDGKTLYSLSEDRTAKAWDAARMVERRMFPAQPETPLALAVRPDQQQIALGRYDGAVVLLDAATGKVQSEPLPPKPKLPEVSKLVPASGQRGTTVRLSCEGKYLEGVTSAKFNHGGLTAKLVPVPRTGGTLALDVQIAANTPAGAYQLTLTSGGGPSKQTPFTVDYFPMIAEQEANDAPGNGQLVSLPATIVGAVGRAGDADYYRFEAKESRQVGVHVLIAGTGSKLEPALRVLGLNGETVAESDNGLLGFTCVKGGTYVLGIRDRTYRGGADLTYRLSLGDIPVVTAVYPPGVQRGTERLVYLDGVHLVERSVKVGVAADAQPGSRVPVPFATTKDEPLGNPKLIVGEFPEAVSGHGYVYGWAMTKERICCPLLPEGMTLDLRVDVPGTGNGIIAKAGETQAWRFSAKKGQTLIVEVNARRLGSPLDSYIEILDADGKPVPRATLRSQAKTYVTFRDHDAAGPGIRLEAWNELGINDYLFVDRELLRIRQLPKGPDDDCQFFASGGQRVGFLDTTPAHHSLGTPMYKVSIHPPRTQFPPNGFPVVTLNYRNDDGGPGYGKDSRLFFDPPADGEYQVRIGDTHRQGSIRHMYRLTVRPPRPGFTVKFTPTSPSVWKGGAVPITVTATRSDGYEGPIDLRLENLPPGFSAPATSIPAGAESTAFALFAAPNATTPPGLTKLKLTARAKIDGKEVVQEAQGDMPKAVEPGDLVTTTDQSEITVQPGAEVRMKVSIERRNGFKGRVPVEVRGLPHGVQVLNIGLNGILITEQETERTFVIRAEAWVEPTEHPIVVLAKREGKNTEHAAKSVLLRVGR